MEFNILICDDDEDILSALEIYMLKEGYKVIKATDGIQALEKLKSNNIHLILMDIMMPNMDGIRATVKIREEKNIPIIMLSAKSEATDKVLGLNMGADDYITKPFDAVELLARVKSQLRRYSFLGGMDIPNHVLLVGGLSLDDHLKKVTVDGETCDLTPIEYHILHLLMSNIDKVFSSKQIYETVWNEPAFHVEKTISVHIRHLREKIEINPKNPQYIKVVYGLGYKISGDGK